MNQNVLEIVDLGIPIKSSKDEEQFNNNLKYYGLSPFAVKVTIRTKGAGRLIKVFEEIENF